MIEYVLKLLEYIRWTNISIRSILLASMLAILFSCTKNTPGKSLSVFQDKLNSGGVSPKMVVIPGGGFLMGSPDSEVERDKDEGPQHQVSIKSFAIGQTELTFDDYKIFADATKKRMNDRGWGRGKRPVIKVSWQDAQDYVRWLSEQTNSNYRLPSEAEWEYAARAGTTTSFNTGECISEKQANLLNSSYANCPPNKKFADKTVIVASYTANAFGLYDMHGNVGEFLEDCWHHGYSEAPIDESAWLEDEGGDGKKRVVRGGTWNDNAEYLRTANRGKVDTSKRASYYGIRLARDLE